MLLWNTSITGVKQETRETSRIGEMFILYVTQRGVPMMCVGRGASHTTQPGEQESNTKVHFMNFFYFLGN